MISFGLERPTFDHCLDGQRQQGKWLYLIKGKVSENPHKKKNSGGGPKQ